MKKKSIFIGIIMVVIILIIGAVLLFVNKEKNTDAYRFKKEYESLNNTIRQKDGKRIRSISIDKNNPFIYKEASDIVEMIEQKESFVVYFGFSDCPWCRSILPTLIEVSHDLGLDTIYYVDVKEIRDELSLENKKVITKKEGTKGYYELLKCMDSILEDYTLLDEENKEIKTGEKRIYAPSVVGVVNGKADKLSTGISDRQTDGYMKLTEEMKQDTYEKLKCVIKCVVEKSKTCSIDKGC